MQKNFSNNLFLVKKKRGVSMKKFKSFVKSKKDK